MPTKIKKPATISFPLTSLKPLYSSNFGKKKKIIYHDPPMKYNVALHKFEVNLPIIKKKSPKKDIQDSGATITVILIIILLIAAFYFISKIY